MTATLTVDSVLEAARKLPIDDQFVLYSKLDHELHGVDEEVEVEATSAWEDELLRRRAEVDAGVAELIPVEDVLAELRGMLRRPA